MRRILTPAECGLGGYPTPRGADGIGCGVGVGLRVGGSAAAWTPVTQPAGFTSTLPFVVQKKGTEFRAWDATLDKEWDPADYAPAVSKTYYVALTGDNGAAGTEAAPLATIAAAVAKGDVDRVIILDQGPYHYGASCAGINLARSMSIIGHASGTVLTAARVGLGWAGSGVHSYTVNLANAATLAFDASNVDGNGEMQKLTVVADAATVDTTPNSIYVDGSGNIYVRLFDDRAPDSDLRVFDVFKNVVRCQVNGAKIYIENLNVYNSGGGASIYTRGGARITAKNCEIAYGAQGAQTLGGQLAFKSCDIHHHFGDGIDYADWPPSYLDAEGIEVDVTSRDNGLDSGVGSNNGSTCHAAAKAFCLNSQYYRNDGRNVADIGASQRWCVACTARDSVASFAAYDCNFANGTSGNADLLWLDSCVSSGSAEDINTGTAGNIYIRDVTDEGNYVGTNAPIPY